MIKVKATSEVVAYAVALNEVRGIAFDLMEEGGNNVIVIHTDEPLPDDLKEAARKLHQENDRRNHERYIERMRRLMRELEQDEAGATNS